MAMGTGLFCVTQYQHLFFTVPCALLQFPGAELGRRGWTGRNGNMENHCAAGVAVQGEVQRSANSGVFRFLSCYCPFAVSAAPFACLKGINPFGC